MRRYAGVVEWWSTAKYQIPSNKSQGVKPLGFGCQEKEKSMVKPET